MATRYCTCCNLIWSSLVEHNYLNHWYTISLFTHAFSATSVTRYSHTHQCSNTNHWWRVNLLLLKILQALKDLVVLHELWERYSYQRCLTSVSVPLHCYSCYTPCWCFCCSKPISFSVFLKTKQPISNCTCVRIRFMHQQKTFEWAWQYGPPTLS